jgi:hypothetical protein
MSAFLIDHFKAIDLLALAGLAALACAEADVNGEQMGGPLIAGPRTRKQR